jgi:hypothetical protein
VSKQTTHKFRIERFNRKKLNEAVAEEQCHVEISNKFAMIAYLLSDRALGTGGGHL